MEDYTTPLPSNEYYGFEDRVYINPTLSRDEQMAFIDKLRETQQQANQQIESQTYNLGTQVPLNLGGLTSGATDPNSYFMSRFQTPQVNAQVANLKTAAQQTALNYILKNQADQMSQRYTTAYEELQKRQYDMNKRHYLDSKKSSRGTGGYRVPTSSAPATTKPQTVIDTIDNTQETIEVNEDTLANERKMLHVDNNGQLYYKDYTGKDLGLADLEFKDQLTLGNSAMIGRWPNGSQLIDGTTYVGPDGTTYLYVQNNQKPNGALFKVV